VLANLESLNAEFIRMGLTMPERVQRLSLAAINRMKSLVEHGTEQQLSGWTEQK
jgi:hypothetical protein